MVSSTHAAFDPSFNVQVDEGFKNKEIFEHCLKDYASASATKYKKHETCKVNS